MFSITLEKKRIKLKTNREMWEGQQIDTIMEKMRASILNQAMELDINTAILSADILMSSSLPWLKAWQSFQSQVIELQMDAMKLYSVASLGHKSKAAATKEK